MLLGWVILHLKVHGPPLGLMSLKSLPLITKEASVDGMPFNTEARWRWMAVEEAACRYQKAIT